MIEQIETTSEETATEATGVADAAHEQTDSLDDVSGRVDDLADQADALLGLLEAFELSTRDGGESSPAVDSPAAADGAAD